MLRKLVGLAILVTALLSATSNTYAAGKYVLAYWRELGAYETGNPPAGSGSVPVLYIHIFDEQGNPRANVPCFTHVDENHQTQYYLGTTDENGYIAASISPVDPVSVEIQDGQSLTDRTIWLEEIRYPLYAQYSYEVGFMYKTDSSNPGAFDINWRGTVNSMGGDYCDLHAPSTNSLGYCSTVPTNYCSDQYTQGNFVNQIGQTFEATGNRVVAVRAKCSVGEGLPMLLVARVLSGGPGGTPVGPSKMSTIVNSGDYYNILIAWGVDELRVTQGNTYYLEITNADGTPISGFYTADNYPFGTYYENGVAQTGKDLMGFVLQMVKGTATTGNIAGSVKDFGGTPIPGAEVTAEPGGYKSQADQNGNYTIYNIPVGNYNVTAKSAGYDYQIVAGASVALGATTTVNFNLEQLINLVTNPGFETRDLTGWTSYGAFRGVYPYCENPPNSFAVLPHSGSCFAGHIVSYTGYNNGGIYQRVPVESGTTYVASTFYFTDSWEGINRQQEYPGNCQARLGVDPEGGTDPASPSVIWTTPWASSHNHWSFLSNTATASSPFMTVFLDYQQTYGWQWNKNAFDDVSVVKAVPKVHIVSGPAISNITENGATIYWSTDVPSTSKVDYGPTQSYGQSVFNSDLLTTHKLVVMGLTSNSVYNYRVVSGAPESESAVSTNGTFTTNASQTVKITDGPNVLGITGTSAIITWTTNVLSTTRIEYGTSVPYTKNVTSGSLSTAHQAIIVRLSPDTIYHFRVRSTATSYLEAISGDFTFRTSAPIGILQNPAFEYGTMFGWSKYGVFDDNGDDGIQTIGWFSPITSPHGGTYFAGSAASYGVKNGCLYQRLSVNPNMFYQLQAWTASYQSGGLPEDGTCRIGIDPYGGIDPQSVNVVWSPSINTAGVWQKLGVGVKPVEPNITVFLNAIQYWPLPWHLSAFDDTTLAAMATGTIGNLKKQINGTNIGIVARTVTAGTSAIGDGFYVEEPDRSSGIKIVWNGQVNEGDAVNVAGVLSTVNGERVINASTVNVISTGRMPAKPVAIVNRGLGGTGVTNGVGLDNTGLLIKTYGKVTSLGTSSFMMTYGAGSLKVSLCPGASLPSIGNRVAVTGPLGCEMVNDTKTPVIHLRRAGDLQTL